MRTIKASEVVKGMRVRVELERGGATQTLEGVVEESRSSDFGDGWYIRVGNLLDVNVSPDHPVTVVAEPEPEWVEGAWYWVEFPRSSVTRVVRRMAGGWSPYAKDKGRPDWHDVDCVNNPVTVLGRVLIVDWPGDDVARTLSKWPDGTAPLRDLDKAVAKVADAIRTQGGAR